MIELITDKDEIIKRVREYLKDNSFIELRDFCNKNCPATHRHSAFVRDVAHRMRRTGDFEIELRNMNIDTEWEIHAWPVPHRPWPIRKPWQFALVMAVIAGLISWIVALTTKPEQTHKENQTDKFQPILNDSLNNLRNTVQHHLADSMNAIRHDTTFLRK